MSNKKQSFQEIYPKRYDILGLVITSIILLVIGLNLPILTVRKLWEKNTYSIISGVGDLWHDGFYRLATIIFFFSVIFPIIKLASLLAVWFIKLAEDKRDKLVHYLEIFGKWSMLDVFVVAIMIVWIKLGALARAKAEIGIYFFCASILLAMIATTMQRVLMRKHKKQIEAKSMA